MRLHIANNEKIISRCIVNFEEVFPGENKWVVLPNSRGRDYIGDNDKVVKCEYGTDQFWNGVGDVSRYDKVIVHCLTSSSADFICKINHSQIFWIEWGRDLYQNLLQCKGYPLYYEKDTEQRLSNRQRWPSFLFRLISDRGKKKIQKLYLKAAKKCKYFVPDSMYDEYPLLLSYYPELKHLQYRDFFYYPIDEVLSGSDMNVEELGPNIIVGHSASPTCNHTEVFEWLSRLNIEGRKVITPLSYNSKANATYVDKRGKALLGEHFAPIFDYMPLDQYNKLLESASYFIYDNYRQEAVGNILVALYLGGKVFLNKLNPLLNFYKSLGVIIFDEDALMSPNGFTPMQKCDVLKNREILMKVYSRERQLSLIKQNM